MFLNEKKEEMPVFSLQKKQHYDGVLFLKKIEGRQIFLVKHLMRLCFLMVPQKSGLIFTIGQYVVRQLPRHFEF